MSIIDRIKVIAQEMAALESEEQLPHFHVPVEELKAAAEIAGKAWSGSWLGYQANVYFKNFDSPSVGEYFSQEWGFHHIFGGSKNWQEYTADQVKDFIRFRAGNLDMHAVMQISKAAASRAMEAKTALSALLSTVTREANPDAQLIGLRDEVSRIKFMDSDEILNAWCPKGSLMSRDTRAATEGLKAPGHKIILAEVAALRLPFAAASELSKLARHAVIHLEAVGFEQKESVVMVPEQKRVFIGHGRSPLWRELKDFVEGDLVGLPTDEFNRVPVAGVSTTDRLKEMLNGAAIALLVLTAEDERKDGSMQARLNVIHEVGLFQGRLGFGCAIVLLEEGCEEFSNIAGLGQIRFPPGRISACFHEVQRVFIREGLLSAPQRR